MVVDVTIPSSPQTVSITAKKFGGIPAKLT